MILFNWVGKTLVFVQLAISIACLIGGLIIYMDKTDWGWKEPRNFHKLRIASELDKRIAAVEDARIAVRAVEPSLARARNDVAGVELAFGVNHFYYLKRLAQLDDLQSALRKSVMGPQDYEKLIDVDVIDRDADGSLKLSNALIGVPLFVPSAELKQVKPLPTYRSDLTKIDGSIGQVISEMPPWIDKMESVAFLLTGKDAADKSVRPGLYDLLQSELDKHEAIEFEKDYLDPLLIDIEDEVSLYLDRRMRLEKQLKQLQDLAAQQGVK